MSIRIRPVLTAVLGIVGALLATRAMPAPWPGAEAFAATQAPQTWQIQVDNVSPDGVAWGFNAFYPDRLQAHPGDTIVFRLAANPNAFHTVAILGLGLTPEVEYSGFIGFIQLNRDVPGTLQAPIFQSEPGAPDRFGEPTIACGRVGLPACAYKGQGALNSGALVNPPEGSGATGNTAYTVNLTSDLAPGPYYFLCFVHGPAMSGSLEVLPAGQPAQSAAVLQAAAQRAYNADRDRLTALARSLLVPSRTVNENGTRTWGVAAGGGSPDPRLTIDEFGPRGLVITADDTVTWTVKSPPVVAHTVSGFATTEDQAVPMLSPFEARCAKDAPGSPQPTPFPPDIWNACPGYEENNFTRFSEASAPSGAPYAGGPRTSGILLNAEVLAGPIGQGMPFLSSYSITFTQPGTYRYACAIHPSMQGSIIVQPHER